MFDMGQIGAKWKNMGYWTYIIKQFLLKNPHIGGKIMRS
jgi:hypothetical protein